MSNFDRDPGTSTGMNIADVHQEMYKAVKLGNNGTLDPLVTALSVMRKIYSNASVDDYGNVVISENAYPDFFKDLLKEIRKLERVIGSVITDATIGDKAND